MTPIALVGVVAYVVLLVYFVALWGRVVLDLVQAFRAGWRPHGAVLVLAEVVYTVTDPPIKAVRRVFPPLRLGAFALDLGFTVVMFAVIVLLYAAGALQRL